MCLRICPLARSSPTPKPSTPALLLIVVRFLTPLRARARIRFSGIQHKPNPPTMMLAPSNTSAIASSALATTLCIAEEFYRKSSLRVIGRTQSAPSPDAPITHARSLKDSIARSLSQLMCPLKLCPELPRIQILADMRQPLLQLQQRAAKIFLVSDRDVPPHRIRAARNPRHLS